MESVTTLQINFECQAKSIYPADPQEIINQLQILTKHLHYAINRKQNLNLDLGLHNKQIQTNSLGDLIKSLTNGFDFIDYVAIDKKDYPAKKLIGMISLFSV
ncbi:MAG: hypothetical protein HC932_02070 [Thermales bacterium]|nr:hypothetical protein [Thermales bacterium]